MNPLPAFARGGRSGFAALACLTSLHAAHWPGFRGADAAGVIETEKAPVAFGPDTNLHWKTALPPGLSSPVVWQDLIFLTGSAEKKVITVCLDRRTGKKRWEQSIEVAALEKVHRVNSVATPTPVTDGKAVYVYFGSLGLVAYDFDGKEVWRKPLPMPKTFASQGTGTSPILADGKLLVFLQLGGDSHLLAVNPSDGSEVWKAPMPVHNNTYSTPVTWQENGGRFVGLICAGRFTAFRLSDGKETWWINELGYQACSTPVVMGERLLIASAGVQGEAANVTLPPAFDVAVKSWGNESGELIAFNAIPDSVLITDRQASGGQGNWSLKSMLQRSAKAKPGDTLDRAQWDKMMEGANRFITGPLNKTIVVCARTGGNEDVTTSQVLWRETKAVPESPSPLVWKDRAYFIRSGGILACRDTATGRMIFEDRIGAPGGYYASPVAADGRIYFASDNGVVTVIKAGDKLEVLARNDLGEAVLASPALAGSSLYIRSAGHLWAFGDKLN